MEYVKNGITFTFAIDVFAGLAWCACALMLLGTDCLDLGLTHVAIAIHFGVQTGALGSLLDDIRKKEARHERKRDRALTAVPITWPLLTVVALVVDIFLLATDVMHLKRNEDTGVCRKVTAFQIALDAANCLACLLSLACFLATVAHIKKHNAALAQNNAANLPTITSTTLLKTVPQHSAVSHETFW
jgi:hypothetical protein